MTIVSRPRSRRWVLFAVPGIALGVLAGFFFQSRLSADSETLSKVECRFEPPQEITVTCYILRVPETRALSLRSRHGTPAKFLDLPVVVVHGRAGKDGAVRSDPVVYLSGGPGDGAWIDPERITWWWGFIAENDWIGTRDLVLFDQRGSGTGRSGFDCANAQDVSLRMLGMTDAAAIQLNDAATQECADALIAADHDAAAYTSVDNAEDLHDLFLALDIERWNVYGLSYGTRLALEYMRQHPDDIRSVILDSVLPPQAKFYEDDAANTDRAFQYLLASCARVPRCASDYPDLAGRLQALVDRLNATPMMVTRPHPAGTGTVDLRIDGNRLIYRFFGLLYNRDDIAYLPRLIDAYDLGITDEINEDLDYFLESVSGREDFGDAMFMSVDCFEELPFNDLVKAEAAYAEYPLLRGLQRVGEVATHNATCNIWRDAFGVTDERLSDDEPVISDLPTLILTGSFDPVTPPRYGRMAARHLKNSFIYEFSGVGHDVIGNDACANQFVAKFLVAPDRKPPTDCLRDQSPPIFVGPAEPPRPI